MKKPTVSKLKKKLDAVFSLWVRNRDKGVCYTCRVQKPIKECDAGHYIGRAHTNTRYDERNVHAQCKGCNIFKHGALDEYALQLQLEYGEGILKELHRLKWETKRFTVKELEELIKKYT